MLLVIGFSSSAKESPYWARANTQKASSPHYADLERTALGHPGHVAVRFSPRSGFPSSRPPLAEYQRGPFRVEEPLQHSPSVVARLPPQPRIAAAAPGTTAAASEPADISAGLPALSASEVVRFHIDGHITTRNLVSEASIAAIRPAIDDIYREYEVEAYRQRVRVCCGDDALAELDIFAQSKSREVVISTAQEMLDEAAWAGGTVPFLQFFNLWRNSSAVLQLLSSEAIAGTAAALLGVSDKKSLRLYQDALFVKRPGDGETHWHSDLGVVPLDTNDYVTCWLPLQPIPSEEDGGSGLIFASGSHRDIARLIWHADEEEDEEEGEQADTSMRGPAGPSEATAGEMQVGDATWHHGWLLHAAGPNPMPDARLALAASFFVDGTVRLHSPQTPEDEDAESYVEWTRDISPGQPARHRLLPVVWPHESHEKLS
eukprot:gnl/TRDRNA2_/TRDRNA2_32825_c0_seq1.p1 gnl/TRDRNA2_/TRDRNA2_32825_c0~~gnl/TRDRNA2_/TRDRNA2_32825_c0_seq1.p1  ORF type:complete len:476 (+),score=60.57 gnl/TRDRNA2_/TRDRNA2_32825_c0_seq1:137-1429(+)